MHVGDVFYLLDIEIMIVAIDSKLHSNNRFRWFKRVTDTRQGHYTNNRQNDLVLLATNSMSSVTIVGVTIVIIIIAAISKSKDILLRRCL